MGVIWDVDGGEERRGEESNGMSGWVGGKCRKWVGTEGEGLGRNGKGLGKEEGGRSEILHVAPVCKFRESSKSTYTRRESIHI